MKFNRSAILCLTPVATYAFFLPEATRRSFGFSLPPSTDETGLFAVNEKLVMKLQEEIDCLEEAIEEYQS